MKKIITISLLILAIVSSLLAGTMAYYTTNLDIATGSVTAKEFIFLSEEVHSFQVNEKIAPSETVSWSFKVMNHDDLTAVTETEQYYKLTFDVTAADNKSAIEPLVVTVKDNGGHILYTVTGTAVFDLFDSFTLNGDNQTREYLVEMHWPADGTNDSAFAGSNFGTAIKVSAVASQVPFDGSGQPGEPEDPENPQDPDQPQDEHDIRVTYEVTNQWKEGTPQLPRFSASIKIENNSDQQINAWNLSFDLPGDRIPPLWGGYSLIESPAGSYEISPPATNNQSIPAGGSISFGFNADGTGESPQNVKVNGQDVQLVYIPFGGNQ